MWEAAQSLMMTCRQSLNKILADPNTKIAPYELASLFNLGFKLGCRANEASNFTCEGPEPPSPEWDEAVRQVYGRSFSDDEIAQILQHRAVPNAAPPASSDPESPSPVAQSLEAELPSTSGSSGVPPPFDGHQPTPLVSQPPNSLSPVARSSPAAAARSNGSGVPPPTAGHETTPRPPRSPPPLFKH
jgi:hypothetical protein